ncbi:hypothetical protein [Wenzhouxiangella marina]|uniref:Uncharacterized protein n=1 Tax=Wenzhouxiangella marina TaxID=1579979 RepID=A0A0K0XZS0_9GAMM|nr:hypothetical protein [Wenzhouxiangella marina]AKS43116.1 hypothetical protein WM2015_2759 [Wenzhouxiangella marina]MBB6087199.1 hypothetical protein [Wenzhouxiangella marina]
MKKDLRSGSQKLGVAIALSLGMTEAINADNTRCQESILGYCVSVVYLPSFPAIQFRQIESPEEMWELDGGNGRLFNGRGREAPENYTECAALQAGGVPPSCSRLRLNSRSVWSEFASLQWPHQIDATREASSYFSYIFSYSGVALGNCYADITQDPSSCEAAYAETLRSYCSYTGSMRSHCEEGVDELERRFAITQGDRLNSHWYAVDFDAQLSLGPFSIDLGSQIDLNQLNQFNRMLIDARAHRNCEFFIGAWDENSCGWGQ